MDQEDMKELKQDVKEILQRTAIHNQLLQEHERRSLALERRQDSYQAQLEPVKKHVDFVNMVLKAFGGLALLVLGQYLLKLVGLL
jgi:hypothetical protein